MKQIKGILEQSYSDKLSCTSFKINEKDILELLFEFQNQEIELFYEVSENNETLGNLTESGILKFEINPVYKPSTGDLNFNQIDITIGNINIIDYLSNVFLGFETVEIKIKK